MSIRLYCDEDSMRHALVAALRSRGLDVTTALEDDMVDREMANTWSMLRNEAESSSVSTAVISTNSIQSTSHKARPMLASSWPTNSNMRSGS